MLGILVLGLYGCQSPWKPYTHIGIEQFKLRRHVGVIDRNGLYQRSTQYPPHLDEQNRIYLNKREQSLQESILKRTMEIIELDSHRQVFQVLPFQDCPDEQWVCQDSLMTRFAHQDKASLEGNRQHVLLDIEIEFYIDNRQGVPKLVEDDPFRPILNSAFWQNYVIDAKPSKLLMKVKVKGRQSGSVVINEEWIFEKDTRDVRMKLSDLDPFIWVDSEWLNQVLLDFYRFLDREINPDRPHAELI